MKAKFFLESLFSLLLITLLFSSCKKDEDNPPAPPSDQPTLLAQEQIGPEGGTLTSDEVTITIPQGAFSKTADISLYSKELLSGHPLAEGALSGLFQLEGIPADFSKPVTVKIKGKANGDNCYLAIGLPGVYSGDITPMAYHLAETHTDGEYLAAEIAPYTSSEKSSGSLQDAASDLILEMILNSGFRKYVSDDFLITIDYPSYVPKSSIRTLAKYINTAHLTAKNMELKTHKKYSVWVGKEWDTKIKINLNPTDEKWLSQEPMKKAHLYPGYPFRTAYNMFWHDNVELIYYYPDALTNPDLLKLEQSAYRAVFFGAGKLASTDNNQHRYTKYFASDLAGWAEGLVTFNPGFKQPLYFDDYVDYSLHLDIKEYFLSPSYSPQLKYVYDKFSPEKGNNLMANIYNEAFSSDSAHALFQAITANIHRETYEWYPDFMEKFLNGDIYTFDNSKLTNYIAESYTIKDIPFSTSSLTMLSEWETDLFRFNIGNTDLSYDDYLNVSVSDDPSYLNKQDVKLMAYIYDNNGTTISHIATSAGEITIPKLKQYENNESILLAVCYAPPPKKDEGLRQRKVIHFNIKIERQDFNTVTYGNLTWMAENLNIETGNSWCYDNDPSNCDLYGRLYDWNTAKTACPPGWHLPSDDEWKVLEMCLGMSQSEADGIGWRGTDEGKKMKSIHGWDLNGNGTNSSGFDALPGGYRDGITGAFSYAGKLGSWWSATEVPGDIAWSRSLANTYDRVDRRGYDKSYGFSVRCVRDD